MSIVISCDSAEATAEWHARVSAAFPLVDVCVYPEVGDASAVEYALVWNHPTGRWSEFPNLRAILSLGAGVDRLAGDPTLPDVPVVRLHDPAMSHDIALYVLHYVIGHQRHLHAYRALQAGRRWQPRDNKTTEEYRVGILGAGNIGTHIGRTLHHMGFGVTAWRKGQMGSKPLEG
ncbi:MAG: glyoxylate/hydroxypyruvate reductase A, partial [Alphaproteobacteria bacterium]|nr:glyoxylate/hydroxypyruvate reductase A [Alphaproteobacteria bacterium]